eukprot:scaffold367422_cov28-Prasinocladus_malaysianus.AAC.1
MAMMLCFRSWISTCMSLQCPRWFQRPRLQSSKNAGLYHKGQACDGLVMERTACAACTSAALAWFR